MLRFTQAAAAATLEQSEYTEEAPALRVIASTPSVEERNAAEAPWPRVPGAVTIALDSEGAHFLLPPFVPCWRCPACDAALHLACEQPLRHGLNCAGGFASTIAPVEGAVRLPLADAPRLVAAEVVALIALAGPTYQAQASVGMVPGDVVFVFGDVGPGAVPLQVLSAGGFRPYYANPEGIALPKGVSRLDFDPASHPLPSPRWHILDLSPGSENLDRWQHLVGGSLSCTLVGEIPADLPAAALLRGQTAVRRVEAIHPHLVLDLLAHLASERVVVKPHIELLDDSALTQGFERFEGLQNEKWLVYAPSKA